MNKIRSMADQIIDTSDLTVHQLRQAFTTFAFAGTDAKGQKSKLAVTLVSFGFKHGIPLDADLVFDVRFLPNPHFVQRLRPKTGRDRAVIEFMEQHAATGRSARAIERPAEVSDSAVRLRREELPDDRHRMHRRPPPVGDDRGGAAEDVERAAGGSGPRPSSGHHARVGPWRTRRGA